MSFNKVKIASKDFNAAFELMPRARTAQRWTPFYYRGIEYLVTVSGSINFAKLQNDRWLNTDITVFEKNMALFNQAAQEMMIGAQAAGNTFATIDSIKEEIRKHWKHDGLPFYHSGVLKYLRRKSGIYDYICHVLGIKSSSSVLNKDFVLAVNELVLEKRMPRLNHRKKSSKSGYERSWFPEDNPKLSLKVWSLLGMLPSNDEFVKDCKPRVIKGCGYFPRLKQSMKRS